MKRYGIVIENGKPTSMYNNFYVKDPDFDILNFIADENILKVFAHYWGKQPYVRTATAIKDTYSIHDSYHSRDRKRELGRFNTHWHYDTTNMLQAHLLLNDTTETDSHTLMAIGSHKTHRLALRQDDYYYSDEYMEKFHKMFAFTGKKGTAFIWDSNAPHKAVIKKKHSKNFTTKLIYPRK